MTFVCGADIALVLAVSLSWGSSPLAGLLVTFVTVLGSFVDFFISRRGSAWFIFAYKVYKIQFSSQELLREIGNCSDWTKREGVCSNTVPVGGFCIRTSEVAYGRRFEEDDWRLHSFFRGPRFRAFSACISLFSLRFEILKLEQSLIPLLTVMEVHFLVPALVSLHSFDCYRLLLDIDLIIIINLINYDLFTHSFDQFQIGLRLRLRRLLRRGCWIGRLDRRWSWYHHRNWLRIVSAKSIIWLGLTSSHPLVQGHTK